jgi:hypothetical protein
MTPRTFALDDGGRILVAANQNSFRLREGERVSTVPANFAVFRIRDDGKLEFVRKYDVETAGARTLFWMGLVPCRDEKYLTCDRGKGAWRPTTSSGIYRRSETSIPSVPRNGVGPSAPITSTCPPPWSTQHWHTQHPYLHQARR